MRQIDGWQKALKDDPAASAVAAGWPSCVPAPLDYGNPGTVAQGLAERAAIRMTPTALPSAACDVPFVS
jgi:hypothetical protein